MVLFGFKTNTSPPPTLQPPVIFFVSATNHYLWQHSYAVWDPFFKIFTRSRTGNTKHQPTSIRSPRTPTPLASHHDFSLRPTIPRRRHESGKKRLHVAATSCAGAWCPNDVAATWDRFFVASTSMPHSHRVPLHHFINPIKHEAQEASQRAGGASALPDNVAGDRVQICTRFRRRAFPGSPKRLPG